MEDRRTYIFFDKINPRLRGFVSVFLIGVGFLFQLSLRNILAGLPFIICCLILNLVKGIKIDRVQTKEFKWQEVTTDRIVQVINHCKKIKKFRSHNIGCIVVAVFLVFGLTFVMPLLSIIGELSFPLVATIFNAIILFAGLTFSGHKSAWMPYALDIKAEIVKRMLGSPLIKQDPILQAVPYLEMGESKEGLFPNDTRFLVRFKDAPKDFVGLQGQISINSVKGRPYPYFYVVLIAKHAFNIFEKFGKHTIERLVIEHKKTKEVDVIVIRQKTTKTSGYHTNTKVQDYILNKAITLTKHML